MSRVSSGRARAQAVVSGAAQPEYSFGVVLVLILVALTFQVAAPETELTRFIVLVLHGLVLMSALIASHAHPNLVRVAGILVLAAIVGSGLALVGPGEFNEIPTAIVNMLFVALTPFALASGLIREIRGEHEVSIRTMLGVLCIYLLVGIFFAFMYAVVDVVIDSEFFRATSDPDISDFLYFSFATLTTVGYGDLTTASELGRSLAITEALIGQIYLVTVVALIVSNMGSGRRRRDP